MTNAATDALFCNLKVLASVRQHERLRTRAGELLDVSPRGVMEGIKRWFSGETRQHNLITVHTVLESAFSYLHADNFGTQFRTRLLRELRAARGGCQALLATYEHDTICRARIECMLESIDEHLDMRTSFPAIRN